MAPNGNSEIPANEERHHALQKSGIRTFMHD